MMLCNISELVDDNHHASQAYFPMELGQNIRYGEISVEYTTSFGEDDFSITREFEIENLETREKYRITHIHVIFLYKP